jgi:Do/DeqQ family serine protease
MKIKSLSIVMLLAGVQLTAAQNSSGDIKTVTMQGGFVQTPVSNAAYAPGRTATGPDLTVAAENTVNAVVHVMTKTQPKMAGNEDMQSDPFFNFFFGMPNLPQQMEPQIASGSGVIISTDGYIVTNNHVVNESDSIQVILNDKRTYTATVVGTDPNTDLALLKIDAKGLPTIVFGNSDELKVGEWVLAVGNPFNLTSTVTAGIVSAKARDIRIINAKMRIESFIQTDAAINPGNSGGALVNTRGELVGINTAIASQTGSYTGYGFAIPVSIVSKVVADLKQYGTVQRALLGVQIQEITDELAKKEKLKSLEGVYVAVVEDRSAAKEAGIEVGDVILKIDNIQVKSISELQEQVGRHHPGDKVTITVDHKGSVKTVTVTLKNSQGSTKVVKNEGMETLGASFEEVNETLKRQLRISGGVQVVGLQKNSLVALSGVQKGFIILKINRKPVKSVSDIEAAVKSGMNSGEQDNGLFLSGIYPNGRIAYYAIDLSGQPSDNQDKSENN